MIRRTFWAYALSMMSLGASFCEEVPPAHQMIIESEAFVNPYASTNEDIVSVKMVSEEATVQPGKPFWICFQFHISPDWHLYWKNPGDAGQGPTVRWMLPPGFRASDLSWPAPERFEIEKSIVFGYSKQLLLLAQVTPPTDLEIGSKVDLKADVEWFGCSKVCVPGTASFKMQLPVSSIKQPPTKHVASVFNQARRALPQAAASTHALISQGVLEVRVSQNIPFKHIKEVLFFPEQQGLLDSHLSPSWELADDKHTLIARTYNAAFAEPQVVFPFKGVLVVLIDSPLGAKKLAWNVHVQEMSKQALGKYSGDSSKPVTSVKAVDEHQELLEESIWYRKLLADFNLFLHSDMLLVLVSAFIGGIILNIMPCVLPVISLKLLHFVQLQGFSRKLVAKHGVIYSFGILISFWTLAAIILGLQSVGKEVGWGFQLQEPLFVTALIIILFILALSLFGVFEFGTSISSTAGAWEQSFAKRIPSTSEQPSLASSFFSGVLATFVATPCTGPLLGSAIGFAATLQPTYAFAVFSALGLGMAFPFLLISFFPGLTKLLPRPGRWMLTFKQLMGFFMLATVLWLVWVLEAQTSGISNLMLLLSLFIISLGVWVFGNWGGLDREKRARYIGRSLALLIVLIGSWLLFSLVQRGRISTQKAANEANLPLSQVVGKEWEPFSQIRLERLVQNGVPVFVDVGAKWCLTCQTNKLVLESDKVKEAFVRYGVVKMYADWTMNDPEITRYIRSQGRNGVPLYVAYSRNPGVRPIILPEVITPDIVIDALKKVHEKSEGE